jgi:hypothetical protein
MKRASPKTSKSRTVPHRSTLKQKSTRATLRAVKPGESKAIEEYLEREVKEGRLYGPFYSADELRRFTDTWKDKK